MALNTVFTNANKISLFIDISKPVPEFGVETTEETALISFIKLHEVDALVRKMAIKTCVVRI